LAVAGGGECDGPARRSGAAAADESRVAIAASKHTDGRTPDQMHHGWAHGSASGSGKWNSGTAGISAFDGRSTSVPRQPRLRSEAGQPRRTAAGAPLGTEVARVLALGQVRGGNSSSSLGAAASSSLGAALFMAAHESSSATRRARPQGRHAGSRCHIGHRRREREALDICEL